MRKRLSPNFAKHLLPILVALLLTSCGEAGEAQQNLDHPNPPLVEDEAEIPDESDLIQDLQDAVADQNCIDCHSDKDQLINTAKPEEVVEAESSGEG